MSQAPRYIPKYTVADYENWQGDWELWDGLPVAMSPSPTFKHQQAQFRLMRLLDDAIKKTDDCGCHVVSELDWHVFETTVVRPDVVVVCEPPEGDFITNPPNLIAEILSPSTAGKDRIYKRDLYAARGVPIYLIVDHENKKIEGLRLVDSAYETINSYNLELHPGCNIDLNLNQLFNA